MNNIKSWIGDFTGIVVGLIALGVVAGVVFGDVPFVGGIAANFADTVNMLGDAGSGCTRSCNSSRLIRLNHPLSLMQ